MIDTFNVCLEVEEAVSRLKSGMSQNVSAEVSDEYWVCPQPRIYIIIFEKWYYRTSSRASVCVSLTSTGPNSTFVRASSTGGGSGLCSSFDWGAGDSFVGQVRKILSPPPDRNRMGGDGY